MKGNIIRTIMYSVKKDIEQMEAQERDPNFGLNDFGKGILCGMYRTYNILMFASKIKRPPKTKIKPRKYKQARK